MGLFAVYLLLFGVEYFIIQMNGFCIERIKKNAHKIAFAVPFYLIDATNYWSFYRNNKK